MENKKNRRILKPGHNCWCTAKADKLAFLVDGQAYFEAVAAAAQKARHSMYILGWEIDSRTRLQRDEQGNGKSLREFLNGLAAANENLEIYLLIWDYAMIYALEREALPIYSLGWKTHERVHFVSDGNHPMAASHHQKVVVIDDQLAFCGGLDLTKHRWDTPEHRVRDRRRTEPSGEIYEPFHDMQVMVSGDAARRLGELFRERWKLAEGHPHPSTGGGGQECWPEEIVPDLENVQVGLSRTCPEYRGRPEVHEVRHLYEDAIAAAKKWIYIENQYFTSYVVRQALEKRLQQSDCPEIVIVLSKRSMGWLEESIMDVLRNRLVQRLQEADPGGKLKVYYPHIPGLGEKCLKVHAKVMVVDDELARVGSSNLSNRSMGFDTECDLSVEAAGQEKVRQTVAGFRNRLVAEHLDVEGEKVAKALEETGSLIEAIEHLRTSQRSLRELELTFPEWAEDFYPDAEWLDPEKPLRLDRLLEEIGDGPMKETKNNGGHKGIIKLGILLAVFLFLAGLWRWSPLQEWMSVDRIVDLTTHIASRAYAPWVVLGAFLLGSFSAFPVTILIGATALIFNPWESLLYSSIGSFAGAAGSYWLGRLLGRNTVRRFAGSRLNSISRQLARRGTLTVAIARNLPVAPFTVVNVVAGASHISFKSYMIGTVLGMLPGITAVTLFSNQLKRFLEKPDTWMFLVLLLLAVGLILLGYLVKSWLERKAGPARDAAAAGSGKDT